ncbi:hypothetical protein [Neisseria benedictiae]|nr:hypothetical protein [Neisseria benedictiae]
MLRRVSDGIKCFDGFQTASNASTGFRRHQMLRRASDGIAHPPPSFP